MTLVINTGLDAVGELDSEGGGLVLELVPELGVLLQGIGEERIVLEEIEFTFELKMRKYRRCATLERTCERSGRLTGGLSAEKVAPRSAQMYSLK